MFSETSKSYLASLLVVGQYMLISQVTNGGPRCHRPLCWSVAESDTPPTWMTWHHGGSLWRDLGCWSCWSCHGSWKINLQLVNKKSVLWFFCGISGVILTFLGASEDGRSTASRLIPVVQPGNKTVTPSDFHLPGLSTKKGNPNSWWFNHVKSRNLHIFHGWSLNTQSWIRVRALRPPQRNTYSLNSTMESPKAQRVDCR